MEKRNVRISIAKPGGNASKASRSYRMSLPTNWVMAMGLSEEERNITISFDGECITIRKAVPEEMSKK